MTDFTREYIIQLWLIVSTQKTLVEAWEEFEQRLGLDLRVPKRVVLQKYTSVTDREMIEYLAYIIPNIHKKILQHRND
jgi:hypothetical protein